MAKGWLLFSSAKPSFAEELANLKRVATDDARSSCLPSHQYPGLDLTGYSSMLRPTPHPDYHVASANGAKRLRIGSSGGSPGPFGGTGPGVEFTVEPETVAQVTSRAGLSVVSAEAAGRNTTSPVTSSRFFNCVEDPPEFSDDDEDYQDDEEEESEELPDEIVDDAEKGERKVADPVQVLDSGLAQHILSFLDTKSLGNCLAVSHGWNRCAQSDFLWDLVCKREWERKHVAPQAVDATVPRARAFQMSMVDAQRVSMESRDLCGWVWEYHLNDPLISGRMCDCSTSDVRKIFLEDGYMYDYSDDTTWDSLVPQCHWELEHAEGKSFLKINGGPVLAVTRTSDWGWKMENSWIVLKSTSSRTALVGGHSDQ